MKVFITGTDTNVGKTLISSWLCLHTRYSYWKPIQTGSIEGTDTQFIQKMSSVHCYKEAYVYKEPCSPHRAAYIEGETIRLENITPPPASHLIIEGAGGILVPINSTVRMIDLIALLDIPVIIVARSGLGTINHTCLTIDALKARHIPILGVIMNGPPDSPNREAIEFYGGVPVLAQFPLLSLLSPLSLHDIPLPSPLKNILGEKLCD